MAYDFYMGETLLPVAPSKLQIKINNQNKTVVLINEGEVNLLKKAGLTDISFTALIPQTEHSFTKYSGGFQKAEIFLDSLESMKTSQKPFQFIVSRTLPDGRLLFDTNMKVSLEDYKISEDARSGFDLSVDISLKQYRDFSTKTIVIEQPVEEEAPQAAVEEQRPADTAPKARTHKVVRGDCMWAISRKYLGQGYRYKEIYKANKAMMDKRNKGNKAASKYSIYPGQVLKIPNK